LISKESGSRAHTFTRASVPPEWSIALFSISVNAYLMIERTFDGASRIFGASPTTSSQTRFLEAFQGIGPVQVGVRDVSRPSTRPDPTQLALADHPHEVVMGGLAADAGRLGHLSRGHRRTVGGDNADQLRDRLNFTF
jgi:hypothetical protein